MTSIMQNVIQRLRRYSDTKKTTTTNVLTMIALATASSCVGLILRIFWKKYQNIRHKYPPEFYGLPIFGSLFTMLYYKENFHIKILPKYGDIVKFNFGQIPFCTIQDVNLMNKVFQKAVDRPTFIEKSETFEPDLAGCNEDDDWSFRRKTVMRSLTLLMNSTKVDEAIYKVCQNITFKELNSIKKDELWYPRAYTRNATFNVIFLAMFGRTLEANDDRYSEYVNTIEYLLTNTIKFRVTEKFTRFIANLLFNNIHSNFISTFEKIQKMTEEDLNTTLNNNNNINNNNNNNDDDSTMTICEYMWQEYKKHNNGIMDKNTKKRIIADLNVLTAAGLDTTGHSLNVGILLLAKYPNIQEIIYNELSACAMATTNDNNINNNNNNNNNNKEKVFSLSKLNECPQFRAFINETLRIACAVPRALPRTTNKDIRCIKYKNGKIICDYIDSYKTWENINNENKDILYDYIIKSDTYIQANCQYASQYNKNIWNLDDDPMTLNLNYWLKKDQNNQNNKLTFCNNTNSVVFSVGPRQCAGISLAMKEMAAFMANLILNYQIKAPNNDPNCMNIKQQTFGVVTATVHPQIGVLVSPRV